MEIFDSLEAFSQSPFTQGYLTFGKFESLHQGHLQLLHTLKDWATENRSPSVLLTFPNNPQAFLRKEEELRPLLPLKIRESFYEKIGLSALLWLPFDLPFSQLSANDFCEKILVEKTKIRGLLLGFNSRFGHRGSGDFLLLSQMAQRFHFDAREFPACKTPSGELLSSSTLRNYLLHGKIEEISTLLGRPYTLYGTVIQGDHLGRTLNFPTANLETDQFLPKNGVYGIKSLIRQELHYGVMNIGFRPTLASPLSPTLPRCEIHFLDFHGDLYHQKLEIELCCFLRDEQKFSSLSALQHQIRQDISLFQSFLKKISIFS